MTKFRNAGIRLKTARMAAGFKSAREFCDEHSIPPSTYSLHETGGRAIRPKAAEKYAELLGINAIWLLTGAFSPYQTEATDESPVSDEEFMNLLKSQPKNGKSSAKQRSTHTLISVNALVFSTVVSRMVCILNEFGILVDEESLSRKAVEIYTDIVQSSAQVKDQLTMINLSMTTFKRQAQETANKDPKQAINE